MSNFQDFKSHKDMEENLFHQYDTWKDVCDISFGSFCRSLALGREWEISEEQILSTLVFFQKKGGYPQFVKSLQEISEHYRHISDIVGFRNYQESLGFFPSPFRKKIQEILITQGADAIAKALQTTEHWERKTLQNEETPGENVATLKASPEKKEKDPSFSKPQILSKERQNDEKLQRFMNRHPAFNLAMAREQRASKEKRKEIPKDEENHENEHFRSALRRKDPLYYAKHREFVSSKIPTMSSEASAIKKEGDTVSSLRREIARLQSDVQKIKENFETQIAQILQKVDLRVADLKKEDVKLQESLTQDKQQKEQWKRFQDMVHTSVDSARASRMSRSSAMFQREN